MIYRIREKAAYSVAGKLVARILRATVYKNSRVHWIQQSMADGAFWRLSK